MIHYHGIKIDLSRRIYLRIVTNKRRKEEHGVGKKNHLWGKNYLSRISLLKKMLILFIGCAIIPITTQAYFYYRDTEKSVQDNMLRKVSSTLDDKADKIDGELSATLALSRKLIKDYGLNGMLDAGYEDEMGYLEVYQDMIKTTLSLNLPYYQQVNAVAVYTDNPSILNSTYVKRVIPFNSVLLGEELLDRENYKISASQGKSQLRVAVQSKSGISGDRSVSVVSYMDNYTKYRTYNKVLKIDLYLPYFVNILKESNLFENMMIADKDGRVIAAANTYSTGGKFSIYNSGEVKDGIVVLKRDIEGFPLSVYGFYDAKVIARQFKESRMNTLYASFLAVILATVCCFAITLNITKRIRLMVKQSKHIAMGNFVQSQYPVCGNDEISLLEKSMNQMSSQLKELIEKEYQAKLLQVELEKETMQAKLSALQSQVNPHFLFNALESIRLKALAKKEEETATMIKYMAKMFRQLINWREDIVKLEDDMKFLEEYLLIQKYRFEDEFSYRIDMEDKVRKYLIPKMIIQPLVENVCVHGVGGISDDRKVSIQAREAKEMLMIEVEDNGVGIKEDKLLLIRAALTGKEQPSSTGLYNIYQRLLLYYGTDFRFDIESRVGKGTKFTVCIPARHQEEVE